MRSRPELNFFLVEFWLALLREEKLDVARQAFEIALFSALFGNPPFWSISAPFNDAITIFRIKSV
jgi:hypothetical protein